MADPPDPAPPNAPQPGNDAPPPSSPYRNLWVPLVVVPALIVIVLVLVFLLFGGIAGSPSTIQEDLDTAVSGGANERTQAVFELTRKIEENRRARSAGREEPWDPGPGLAGELRSAWTQLDEEDHQIRYVVAALLLQAGDEQGVRHMREFLELTDEEDPDGELRRGALLHLALVEDEAALERAVELSRDDDKTLRTFAVIFLSKMDTPEANEALAAALGDAELEVRANAAIALSGRGDDRGTAVLVDLLDPATIEGERERHPDRYRTAEQAVDVRIAAAQALGRIDSPEARAALERTAEDDPNLTVRQAAAQALGDSGEPAER